MRPSLVFIFLGFVFTTSFCSAETIVAVGYGGRRMSSSDGKTWENVQQWAEKGADDWNNLISVCYGQGKFVCVGGGGWSRDTQAGHILVSTDGKEWREVAKYPFRVSPILFHEGRFVAGGPNHKLLCSEDGEKWHDGGDIALPQGVPGWALWFRKGVSGNGRFIFMGNAGKDQSIWWTLVTKDGEKVEHFSTDLPKVEELAFGAGKFFAATKEAVLSSADGIKWESSPAPEGDELKGLIWTGTQFYLSGKKGAYTSKDGINWTGYAKTPPCHVVFSNDHTWIGTGWPGTMFYSKDGKTWEKTGQPAPAMGVNSVAVNAGK